MTLADRDLVDADRLGAPGAGALEPRTHVLFVELLDRVPVKAQLLGNILDRRQAGASPHVIRKAFGIERIVGQERQSLALHRSTLTTLTATNPTNLDIEQNTKRSARQIPHLPPRSVVEAAMHRPARSTVCFFARRARVTTRICGSPNRPRAMAPARKPGNECASASRRRLGVVGIRKSCQIYAHLENASYPMKIGLSA